MDTWDRSGKNKERRWDWDTKDVIHGILEHWHPTEYAKFRDPKHSRVISNMVAMHLGYKNKRDVLNCL